LLLLPQVSVLETHIHLSTNSTARLANLRQVLLLQQEKAINSLAFRPVAARATILTLLLLQTLPLPDQTSRTASISLISQRQHQAPTLSAQHVNINRSLTLLAPLRQLPTN
jgi:hypothetical protein